MAAGAWLGDRADSRPGMVEVRDLVVGVSSVDVLESVYCWSRSEGLVWEGRLSLVERYWWFVCSLLIKSEATVGDTRFVIKHSLYC